MQNQCILGFIKKILIIFFVCASKTVRNMIKNAQIIKFFEEYIIQIFSIRIMRKDAMAVWSSDYIVIF